MIEPRCLIIVAVKLRCYHVSCGAGCELVHTVRPTARPHCSFIGPKTIALSLFPVWSSAQNSQQSSESNTNGAAGRFNQARRGIRGVNRRARLRRTALTATQYYAATEIIVRECGKK